MLTDKSLPPSSLDYSDSLTPQTPLSITLLSKKNLAIKITRVPWSLMILWEISVKLTPILNDNLLCRSLLGHKNGRETG